MGFCEGLLGRGCIALVSLRGGGGIWSLHLLQSGDILDAETWELGACAWAQNVKHYRGVRVGIPI